MLAAEWKELAIGEDFSAVQKAPHPPVLVLHLHAVALPRPDANIRKRHYVGILSAEFSANVAFGADLEKIAAILFEIRRMPAGLAPGERNFSVRFRPAFTYKTER